MGVSGLRGYEDLPPWVKEGQEPDPRLRDALGGSVEYVSASKSGAGSSAASQLDAVAARSAVPGVSTSVGGRVNGLNKIVGEGKAKTLDDWLDEEEEEEESSEEGEDSESAEEEESEEEGESEYETESEEETDDEKAGLVK